MRIHAVLLLLVVSLAGCFQRADIYGALQGGILSTSGPVPADGKSSADIIVRVFADGIPLAGVTVVVSSTGVGTIAQPAPTDSNGVCRASMVSNDASTQTLSATVTVKRRNVVLPLQGNIIFSKDIGSSIASGLTASPSRVTAGSTTVLTATVKDTFGQTLSGQAVTFISSGRGDTFSAVSGTTDANGRISTSLSSKIAETKTVTASFSQGFVNANVTFVAGPASSLYSTLVASPNALVANGVTTTNLKFTAADTYGNTIQGCQVTFSSHGLGGILTKHSATTDASGQATSLYHGTRAGLLSIVGTCQSATASAAVSFTAPPTCTTGTPIYSSPPQIFVGGNTVAVKHGDLNEDGIWDIVTASADGNAITLALGLGNALFYPGVSLGVGNRPSAIAMGDVNGDQHLDCVVVNGADNTFEVVFGDGRGNLQPGPRGAVGGNPSAIALADLNSDSHLDLVVSNANDATMSVLLGSGDGTFTSSGTYGTSAQPRGVALTDINADGHVDAVLIGTNSNNIDTLLGTGTGAFAANVPVPGSGPHGSFATADINSDGIPDVVAAAENGTWIETLTGIGNGSLSAPSLTNLASQPIAIALADITRDGHADIVVTASQVFYTLPGNGDGTFGGISRFPGGASPGPLDICDADGDDNLDVLAFDTASNHVSVTLGDGTGILEGVLQFDAGGVGNNGAVFADFNGDGNVDAALATYYSQVLVLAQGNGDGTFRKNGGVPLGGSPVSVFAGDFNGDGKQDLGGAWITGPGGLVLALGNGDGTMQTPQNVNNTASCLPNPPPIDVNGMENWT